VCGSNAPSLPLSQCPTEALPPFLLRMIPGLISPSLFSSGFFFYSAPIHEFSFLVCPFPSPQLPSRPARHPPPVSSGAANPLCLSVFFFLTPTVNPTSYGKVVHGLLPPCPVRRADPCPSRQTAHLPFPVPALTFFFLSLGH